MQSIDFQAYKRPPAIQRGRCKACDQPSVEMASFPPLPKLMVVPCAAIDATTTLPAPELHIFYHRRVADIDDKLPKYSGYLSSQLAFSRLLLGTLMRERLKR